VQGRISGIAVRVSIHSNDKQVFDDGFASPCGGNPQGRIAPAVANVGIDPFAQQSLYNIQLAFLRGFQQFMQFSFYGF
jgi:hypothetical protein